MKTLFILPYDALPANAGNKTLTCNLLKYLTNYIECDIAIMVDDNNYNTKELYDKYKKSFPKLYNLYIYNKPDSVLKYFFKVKYLIKGFHPSLGNFFNRKLKNFLIQIDNFNKYDIIHFDMFHMTIYIKYIKNTPSILVASDAYSNASSIAMRFNKNLVTRFLDYCNTLTIKNLEKNVYPHFNRVCIVSEIDIEYLTKLSKNSNFIQIGIGVANEYFPEKNDIKQFKGILILGSLNHNIISDNIVTFLNSFIGFNNRYKIPITILGKNPSKKILKCINKIDYINLIEYVDDFSSFLNQDWVCVYPQKCGSGLQTKVQQAMAIGLPVVANAISFGGLGICNDYNCIVSNNEIDLCKSAMELSLNEYKRKFIGSNATKHIKSNFSISKIGSEMLNIYNSII